MGVIILLVLISAQLTAILLTMWHIVRILNRKVKP